MKSRFPGNAQAKAYIVDTHAKSGSSIAAGSAGAFGTTEAANSSSEESSSSGEQQRDVSGETTGPLPGCDPALPAGDGSGGGIEVFACPSSARLSDTPLDQVFV